MAKALVVLLFLLALGGAALLLPLRSAPPEAGAAVLGPTPTRTPLPRDDIRVAPPEIIISPSLTNEALAVAGENVYVVYSPADGGVYSSRSTDGGHTFFPPVLVAFPGDLASLARREGAPPEETDLYVVFEVFEDDGVHVAFTRSPDGGDTWILPIFVPVPGGRGCLDAEIAVDAGGTIYITCRRGPFYLTRSTDGGGTWSEPFPFTPDYDSMGGVQVSSLVVRDGVLYFVTVVFGDPVPYDFEVVFTKSTDGGETWTEPVRVNDRASYGDIVDLAVDAAGVIYVAFTNTGSFTYMTRSTDGGATWRESVRVDDGGKHHTGSYSGAIAWDERTVSLHVALSDGRNYWDEDPYYGWCDIFYTYSTDGGKTWSPNEQISDPIPYTWADNPSIQTWEGVVYTTYVRGVMLDIHDPHLPPVTMTPTPTPWPTHTPSPTPPPTASPTASPTSPAPTPTASPTASPSPTPSPTPAGTPPPTATPVPPEEWRVYLPWVEKG